MSRTTLTAAALAATLFIAGCASTPPVQAPEQLRATHGFVRITIPQLDQFPAFQLKQEGTGVTFALTPQEGAGPRSFGRWIPAGAYRIEDMKQADGQPFPSMRVEAGRLLDLGALTFLQLGNYELLDLVMPHPEAEQDLEITMRQLAPHLSSMEPLRWSQTTVPAARRPRTDMVPGGGLIQALIVNAIEDANRPPLKERLRQAATPSQAFAIATETVPPATDEPAIGPGGERYYGADLGQVRVRRPDGRWTHLDTGSLQAITAVAASGLRIVAGTVQGDLRVSEDGGKTWTLAPARFPGQAVADIDRVGGRWFVLTTTETRDLNFVPFIQRWRLSVLDGERLDNARPLRDQAMKYTSAVIGGNRVRGVAPNDGSAYYVNGFDTIIKVDPATLAVSRLAVPIDLVGRLNVGQDQRTLSAYVSGGMFSKLVLSTDGGATWTPRPAPPYPGVDVFVDDQGTVRATRWDVGAFKSRLELQQLAADGHQWKPGPKIPEDCLRMLTDGSGAPSTCVMNSGRLLTYRSDKWVAED
ncbi:hypothetical protein [Mitsuaria sp. 7]|uniref:hypothetical protein n=1 Tax=Mitsuaria sp. 7 TaxID=1658665 RepID=UPI0007DE0758|nr:hypothetical protein [Mitsuaria sp. 7]ANH67634.1 hypothetical protein ABE85_08745 [Mitsuaria sp. 7]